MSSLALLSALFILVTWCWLLVVVFMPHRHDSIERKNWLRRIFR